jgi:hypothetical protein
MKTWELWICTFLKITKSDRWITQTYESEWQIQDDLWGAEINSFTDQFSVNPVTNIWWILNTLSDLSFTSFTLERVGQYWNDILARKTTAGSRKFLTFKKVVKSALCIFYSNSYIECCLLVNKKVLTPKRTLMSDEALNCIRITRDMVKM